MDMSVRLALHLLGIVFGNLLKPAEREERPARMQCCTACPVLWRSLYMALVTILQSYSPQEFPFAVDITDTVACPWHRWLQNVVENQELIDCGIVKVYALWPTSSFDKPQIFFCHPDDTCTQTRPEKKLQYQRDLDADSIEHTSIVT